MIKKYKTRQSEKILEYLENKKGCHVTAFDIVEDLKKQGEKIGLTTVYRQMDKLIGEGIVYKHPSKDGGAAVYEHLNVFESCHENKCYHFKCDMCGQLFHLDCVELQGLQNHIDEAHGFVLDYQKTVFYGSCQECLDKKFDKN